MPSDIDKIEKLIARLPSGYVPPIIIIIVFHYLYMNSYSNLGNVPTKFPEPFNTLFSMFPLIIYTLIMAVASSNIIIRLIFKNKNSVEKKDIATTKLGIFNQNKLNNLIDQFELSHTQAKGLSTRMRRWRSGGYFEPQDKLDLKGWCKVSDDNRKPAREIARKISILVFGKDISKE